MKLYIYFFIFYLMLNYSNTQSPFSCAPHICGAHLDRSCLKVRNSFPGIVRSEFIGNNCACCVHRRSDRVADVGIELQKNIVADVKSKEFRYTAGSYCTAYFCGGIYDSVCSKLVSESFYPNFISRNILCQCCITPNPSQSDIEALFNRNIVDMVWKKEKING